MPPRTPSPRHVAMVAYPGANAVDVIGPLEVFATAAALAGRAPGEPRAYTTEIVAMAAGPVETQSGLHLVASRALGAMRGGVDTLLVAGGLGTQTALGEPPAAGGAAPAGSACPSPRVGLLRQLPARRGGIARRPPRDDALDVVRDARGALPAGARRAGSHLRARRKRVDVRRGHGGHGPRARARRGRSRPRPGAPDGAPDGALPSPARRPVPVQRPARGPGRRPPAAARAAGLDGRSSRRGLLGDARWRGGSR